MSGSRRNANQATSAEAERRYRPLGLTIALAATALGYGVTPMLPLLIVAWSQITRRGVSAEILGGPLAGITMGLGAVTLLACIVAWIGRPVWIRWVVLALVWIQTGLLVFRVIQSLTIQTPAIGEVGGSLSGSGLLCQTPILVLVPLYVTWYLNRAPARAFYRPRTRVAASKTAIPQD